MKYRIALFIAVCLISLIANAAQQGSVATKTSPVPDVASHLQIAATSRSVPFLGAWSGKARCDNDGNVYVHLINAETGKQYHKASQSPISRIQPDGALTGGFPIASAGSELSALDFFVSKEGKVYEAAFSQPNPAVYVIAFSSDGSLQSKIRMDTAFFVPYQIVAFPSGEFLLSGTAGPDNRTPFTAVFGPSGTLIRRINEREDEDSRHRAEGHEAGFESEYTNTGNLSIWHGDAALGSDGNAYLLRAVSPALIYVISSKGEVTRKLHIDSPGSGLTARSVRSDAGKLAISFLEQNSTAGMVRVVDYDGNSIATYSSDDKGIYPGLPGCYTSSSFTFVHTDDQGNVQIHRAEPK